MENTGLMLGNWVKLENGEKYQIEPHHFELNEDGYNACLDLSNPIPLNEERLLELGFKKWKNKKMWSYKNVLVYYHNKFGFCYGKSTQRVVLKYVHKVQNLVHVLTDEELTIQGSSN